MSRNYGLGTRDMASAGTLALDAARRRGDISYSTAATVSDRWAQFAAHAKAAGVGRMERVTGDLVRDYGRELAEQVRTCDCSASYAQNLVSAVNTVMRSVVGSEWQPIGPVRDCGIPQRCAIREGAPTSLDRKIFDVAVQSIRDKHGDRSAAIVGLCRELGLRPKEASLLDARTAHNQAVQTGSVKVDDGTKGGRARLLELSNERQVLALRAAAVAQAGNRSVTPPGQTWKQWRDGVVRDTREAVREACGDALRDLRSAYACERYKQLTGHAAPCTGEPIVDRHADIEARKQIAQELGHGRIDVVAEYVGGRA